MQERCSIGCTHICRCTLAHTHTRSNTVLALIALLRANAAHTQFRKKKKIKPSITKKQRGAEYGWWLLLTNLRQGPTLQWAPRLRASHPNEDTPPSSLATLKKKPQSMLALQRREAAANSGELNVIAALRRHAAARSRSNQGVPSISVSTPQILPPAPRKLLFSTFSFPKAISGHRTL